MNIIYDNKRRSYFAVDLGSKNGSILNGSRMSESEVVSEPMEVSALKYTNWYYDYVINIRLVAFYFLDFTILFRQFCLSREI